MHKQQTDYLVQLIRSLTKAEKRHFRLFATRNQASGDILFLQLFDIIEKQQGYEEALILKKIPQIKKRQLSNLKAHLYKQLLMSLRLLGRNNSKDIEIREKIDYAKVLYDKGLYRQSLEMLDRTKTLSLRYKQYVLALEIIEFEKLIESQYITRSINTRADELTKETFEISDIISRIQKFSNLSLQLYGLYLKVGYVRNEKDHYFVTDFFNENLPKFQLKDLTFYEKLYLYQSYVWYYHTTQDFLNCYKYTQRWIDLFEAEPEMMQVETPLYLKGLHNLLSSLFYLNHYDRFIQVLDQLENFDKQVKIKLNSNIEGMLSLFRYLHRIHLHYLQGTFEQGLTFVPNLITVLETNPYNWDAHRMLVFNYRIACLYFGSSDYDNAIVFLNKILNAPNPDFREDIQAFARFLNLMAHYELGNIQLVEYLVKSVYRFLKKREELHEVLKEILQFIRRLPRVQKDQLNQEFLKLRNNLVKLQNHPYERRPFLYLDIISWLEGKIQDKPIQVIIREKFLAKSKA